MRWEPLRAAASTPGRQRGCRRDCGDGWGERCRGGRRQSGITVYHSSAGAVGVASSPCHLLPWPPCFTPPHRIPRASHIHFHAHGMEQCRSVWHVSLTSVHSRDRDRAADALHRACSFFSKVETWPRINEKRGLQAGNVAVPVVAGYCKVALCGMQIRDGKLSCLGGLQARPAAAETQFAQKSPARTRWRTFCPRGRRAAQ